MFLSTHLTLSPLHISIFAALIAAEFHILRLPDVGMSRITGFGWHCMHFLLAGFLSVSMNILNRYAHTLVVHICESFGSSFAFDSCSDELTHLSRILMNALLILRSLF